MAPHTEQLTRPAVQLRGLTRSFDGRTVLDGIDLEKLVSRYGAQPASRVINILLQISGALD